MADWWRNAGVDEETAAIDRLPGAQAPDEQDLAVRGLITSLESCHHKAHRHVELILQAIADGRTAKGPGRRPPGAVHPAEIVWREASDLLRGWLSGAPGGPGKADIGGLPVAELFVALGPRTPLKRWQVGRVVDRIESFLDPSREYVYLECNVGPYGEPLQAPAASVRPGKECGFLEHTLRTAIHDTVAGQPAEISLALAIDLLMPCHWRFPRNLLIVLGAIGGKLDSDEPLCACSRNIELAPAREQMRDIAATMVEFSGRAAKDVLDGTAWGTVRQDVLAALGPPTPVKVWLAVSLGKTLRLQLYL